MIIVMSKGYKNQHFMKNNFHSEMHEKVQIANSKESENITFFLYFSSQCIHIINIRIVTSKVTNNTYDSF